MIKQPWIDQKVGPIRIRVLLLGILFIFNALIAIGASMYYLYDMTSIVMYIGFIGTIICIALLSTPAGDRQSTNQ